MENKTILFLNLRQNFQEARSALLAAKRLGYDVVLLSDKAQPIFEHYIKHTEVVDTYNLESSLNAVKTLNEKTAFSGVITWADRDVELMALVAETLNLPGPSVSTAKNARNKYSMREALKSKSEFLPRYFKVTDHSSLTSAVERVGFPAIIKPTGASGSKGIFKVNTPEEAKKALDALFTIADPLTDKIFSYYGSEFIFEEYLDGNEFSVEGWVYNHEVTIVGITDKKTTDEYHIEYQHIFPSNHTVEIKKAIMDATRSIVIELGFNNCAFHLEAKWTSNGLKLVEVAARIGGGYITSHLIPLSTNINFYEQLIRVVTGLPPITSIDFLQYSGVRSLLASSNGTLTNITGLSHALTNPRITHVFQEQKNGNPILLPPENFGQLRAGTLIAQGGSHEEVDATFKALAEVCEIEMKMMD